MDVPDTAWEKLHARRTRECAPARIRPNPIRPLSWALLVAVLIILILCGGASPAVAALTAYEGFNYTPNTSIAGQSGGSGWSGSWEPGPDLFFMLATNVATGLTYTDLNGRALLTSGGSLVVGNPYGPASTPALPTRHLSTNLSGGTGVSAGPGGTVWMSLLYQRLNLDAGGAPYFRRGNLGLVSWIDFGERLSVGGPNTSASVSNVFSVWGSTGSHSASAPFQSASHPLPTNTATFILLKIVTDGTTAADTAYVWFNPTNLTVEPGNATADLTDNEVNLSPVDTLWFWAAEADPSGTNAAFQVDELRVGSTFADVTPNAADTQIPTILEEPQDLAVIEGQPAGFAVAVSGSAPLTYQWYFNTNTPLPDATNSTYDIASTVLADAGGYSVVITNNGGSVTSRVAALAVEVPTPPEITAQSQDRTSIVGSTVIFSVTATGTAPLHYQWYYNINTPLAKKTNATLNLTITSTNDSGGYSVIVTNAYGAATSTVVQLTAILRPAFPGADGAARYVCGGHGGLVYHVTKLNSQLDDPERDSPGTFLYGLNNGNFPAGMPRTIVFDVAGVFHLGMRDTATWTSGGNAWNGASRQGMNVDNLTIAGQTAPGPVIFMGGTLKPQGNNMVVRNITIAAGYGMDQFWAPGGPAPSPGDLPTSFTMDAMDISGQNIIVDHVDAFYGSDESISWNELADNITIQYCNNAMAQNYDSHSYGHLLQADTDHKTSFIHNLDAHVRGRLPRVGSEVGTGALNDFRNTIFYNWLGGAGYSGAQQYSKNNFIQNFYLSGPGGDSTWASTEGGGTGIFGGSSGYTFAYVSGNLKDTNKDGDPNDTVPAGSSDFTSTIFQPSAYDIDIGVTLNAREAFTNVLRYVGSRWWERDYDITLGNTGAIDTLAERLIHDVIAGTGRIEAWADDPYDSDPNEGAEWRALWALRMDTNGVAPYTRPAGWDSDQDGMPDSWETEHDLDPNVANNNGDFDNDLYTDLEEYLNDIAAWPAPGTIYFTGEENNRYARIFNWRVHGIPVNISGKGTVTTSSQWQPSRYDSAVIANQTVIVDAVGQHAGSLKLQSGAALHITNGWLKVATLFENTAGCTVAVSGPGTLTTSNLLNAGTLRLSGAAGLNVSGTFTNTGTLDIMAWTGTLPGGLVNLGTILDRNVVVMTGYELNGADAVVTIQGYTGHNYQLQFCDDLGVGDWQNVGASVPGADVPIQLIHPNGASESQRFYRVLLD